MTAATYAEAAFAAEDLASLCREGFGVAETTTVSGEYKGCDYGKTIRLSDSYVLVCGGYNYHYAYSPEVLILKNVVTGATRILVDGERFDGSLARSP